MSQLKNRPVSETHYLIIDCAPGLLRPDNVLKLVLVENNVDDLTEEDALMYDDGISVDDFTLVSANFGEWKYAVYKEKEQLFEDSIPKISDLLMNLYRSNLIRYAEWRPKNN